MTSVIILFLGSFGIFIWGISHLFMTKTVVKNFGELSEDNRRIITMEWIVEGVALSFLGVLVFCVTFFGEPDSSTAVIVYRAAAVMLLILASLTYMTGAKTLYKSIQICPLVKTITAILFLLGSF